MNALDRLSHRDDTTVQLLTKLGGRSGFVSQTIEAVDGPRVRIDGRWVLNFTSSNYLGLNSDPYVRQQAAAAARRWGSSLATPRLLATDTLTAQLETALADLVGTDAALLFPSTLHAASDVLSLLASSARLIALDERAYPISETAARSVAWPNRKIVHYRHGDTGMLAHVLERHGRRGAVIVCDGIDPIDGVPTALQKIGRLANLFAATVYVDDAHGLGILGEQPTATRPFGTGGGGILRYCGPHPGNIAYASSLAKAFGVPLAFAAGPSRFIEHLRQTASSVIHSSPPSLPNVAAALATLRRHEIRGDGLRLRLVTNVQRFRSGILRLGLPLTTRTVFPIQSIAYASPAAAIAAGRNLRCRGIWPVLAINPGDNRSGAALRFVLTAQHDAADIDDLLDAL